MRWKLFIVLAATLAMILMACNGDESDTNTYEIPDDDTTDDDITDDDNDDDAIDDDVADDDVTDDDITDDDITDDDITDDDTMDCCVFGDPCDLSDNGSCDCPLMPWDWNDCLGDDDTVDDDITDDDATDDDTAPPPPPPGFVTIFPGTFAMGSPITEPGRGDNETQHEVMLTHKFEMSIYETTQGEFESLMGWNPSYFGPNGAGANCGDDCPVENVSWFDAVAYANELLTVYAPCYTLTNIYCNDGYPAYGYMACMNNDRGGILFAMVRLNGIDSVYECGSYRLPTEAEWEYVTRADTTTAFYSGGITNLGCDPLDPNLDAIGWYCGNKSTFIEASTQPVGQKLPNAWSLYDMSGNVSEYGWDAYADYLVGSVTNPEFAGEDFDARVTRGSAYNYIAQSCRSANRSACDPMHRSPSYGFRLVRSWP